MENKFSRSICMRHYNEVVGRINKDNGRNDTLGFLLYAYCSLPLSALCPLPCVG